MNIRHRISILLCAAVSAFSFAGFGVYSFIEQKLTRYLFLQTHFVFFDYEMNGLKRLLFFAEYISIITLFAAAFYYLSKLLKRGKKKDREQAL